MTERWDQGEEKCDRCGHFYYREDLTPVPDTAGAGDLSLCPSCLTGHAGAQDAGAES